MCLLTAAFLLAGCTDPVGKTVSCGDIQLTVPGDFTDLSTESYAQDADLFYGWGTLIFIGLKESKASLQAMTLEEYTGYVVSGNELSCTPTAYGDGYRFTYETPIENIPYTYTVATYEGAENFWILQFYCPSEKLEENQPEIDIILQSIQPNPAA